MKEKAKNKKSKKCFDGYSFFFLFYLSLCLSASVVISSCSYKPTNLRTLAPADSLIYIETNDLAAALQPIIDSKALNDVAKSKPDFSAIRGVQLAVAVTGFEMREEKLTGENSIGRVRPHFAAIADTHAWGWQTRDFAENKIGEFINNVYGGGVTLEVSDKNGGKYYVWTAEDGQKAYAFVEGSLIFFGNNEASIEKCLAVKRGEADAIAKNPKLPQADASILAWGYVSPDGVAQIANIAGLAMAAETSENEEVKSFIAGVLPQLLRNSVSEVLWTAVKSEQGIQDKYVISMPPDVSGVFNETFADTGTPDLRLLEKLPDSLPSVTLYDLRNPQAAWRSAVLMSQKNADPVSGKIIQALSPVLFDPYGIADGELFLSSVGSTIVTAEMDEESDKKVVVASVKDAAKLRQSLKAKLRLVTVPYENGSINIWKSDDGTLAADFQQDYVILGDTESVLRCVGGSRDLEKPRYFLSQTQKPEGAVNTLSTDQLIASELAEMLSEKKSDDAGSTSTYFIQTRFTKKGMERRVISDFGLIGAIIEQFGRDE